MDKLINLESIKSIISSVVNENKMTDEEIAECGVACGCGTTTADLGAEVQYLGDKKKAKKEFLDFGTTSVNGNGAKVGNEEDDEDKKEANIEDIDSKMASFLNRIKEYLSSSDEKLNTIEKLDKYQSIGLMFNDLLEEVGGLEELINLAKNGNTYAKEILDKFDLGETVTTESTLQEDEVEEMARGVLAPQEQARRDYIAEYPEYKDVLKRADQFMKQVLNNPEAPGYEKYVKHFANLLKNGNRGTWSNVSSAYELNTDKRANNKKLATDYANTILNHRKNMGKASYASKGTMNAYQRNIVKRGSYYKPGRDMVEPEQTVGMSLGQQIADQYNSVPVEQSNSVLAKFFKSTDWNNLSTSDKYRTLKVINDEADLDMAGVELVNKAKMNIGDDE